MSLVRRGCGIHAVWLGTGGAGVTEVRFASSAWALPRQAERHCVHATWMWHPQRSVRAVDDVHPTTTIALRALYQGRPGRALSGKGRHVRRSCTGELRAGRERRVGTARRAQGGGRQDAGHRRRVCHHPAGRQCRSVIPDHLDRCGVLAGGTGRRGGGRDAGTVSLPLYGYCVFTGSDGTTLQADPFRSHWSNTLAPGFPQRGVIVFSGHLPPEVLRAAVSFTQIFGPGGGSITVRPINLTPG